MSEIDLESAWEAFVANDLPVDAFFQSIGMYQGVENAKFLQTDLSSPAEVQKLVELGRRSTSFHLSEKMASALERAGQPAAAIEVRGAVLPFVPRWAPAAVARMLALIAEDLGRCGRFDDAATFAERAIAWDPTQPNAIAALGRARLEQGRATEAAAALAYLDHWKFPRAIAGDDLERALKARGAKAGAPLHAPDLTKLHHLDEAAEARAIASSQLDPSHINDALRLRSQALICAMAGHHEHARFAARLLAEMPMKGVGPVAELEHASNQALAAAILGAKLEEAQAVATAASEPKLFSGDAKARGEHAAKAAKAGKRAIAAAALRDPAIEVLQKAARIFKGQPDEPAIARELREATRAQMDYVGWNDSGPRVKLPFPPKGAPPPARAVSAVAKKTASPAPVATASLRGEALAREVVRTLSAAKGPIRAHGVTVKPKPLPAKVVEALRLQGDHPLPPSLRVWLQFDASWIGLFDDLKHPELHPLSLTEVLQDSFQEMLPTDFPRGFKPPAKLRGAWFPLPSSGDQLNYLYAGVPDALGELPVLAIDPEDLRVFVKFAGFDVYLAASFRVPHEEVPTAEQEKANLGKPEIDLGACFPPDAVWGAEVKSEKPAKAPAKKAVKSKKG